MRLRTVHVVSAAGLAVGLVAVGLVACGVPSVGPANPAELPAAADEPPATSVEFTASGDYGKRSQASAVLTQVATIGPDLHLALGDLSYSDPGLEDEWCDFVTSRVGAGYPFELVSGNHESDGEDGNINDFSPCLPNQLPGLVGTYGRQWYVDVPQEAPLVRFIAISPGLTYPSGDWSYAEGSAGHTWTSATIDAARDRGIPWVVVAQHMPCLSIGIYECPSGQAINDLLIEKRVDLVLSGHEHSYMRTHQLALGQGCPAVVPGSADTACIADDDSDLAKGAGTVFVIAGTGGTTLRDISGADPEAPYFATSSGLNANPTWGNIHVVATADTLTAEFLRAYGGTFTDSFSITVPDPQAG